MFAPEHASPVRREPAWWRREASAAGRWIRKAEDLVVPPSHRARAAHEVDRSESRRRTSATWAPRSDFAAGRTAIGIGCCFGEAVMVVNH